MKNNILENIIKRVLFENDDKDYKKSRIKSISKKQQELATSNGAVFAYAVKVIGTSNPTKIKNVVLGATIPNSTVGKSSIYAQRDNPHWYVMSDPKPDNRQLINIWIIPNTGQLDLPTETGADQTGYTYSSNTIGGNSKLITRSSFEQQLKYINDLRKKSNMEQTNLDLNDLETEDPGTDVADTDSATLSERQKWLNQNNTENVTYPYEWYTFLNNGTPINYTVYKETILDNVPYLYFYDKQYDLFFVLKQVDQFLPTIKKEQSNPDFTAYTWQKLWDQIDISTVTPDEHPEKLEAIYLKEK